MRWLQIRLKIAIHKKFKKKCEEELMTMSEKIRQWITEYLDGEK